MLGLVVTEEQPLGDVNKLIDELTGAGVRFVYFSPENDQQSKTVGLKLGLEIDWNSYISLSVEGEDQYGEAVRAPRLLHARIGGAVAAGLAA